MLFRYRRLLFSGSVLALFGAGCSNAAPAEGTSRLRERLTTSGLHYHGANLSGAEHGFDSEITEPWGDAIPGTEGTHYAWPDPATNAEMDEVDILLDLGMNTFRLPFQWERLQPALGGEFAPAYLGRLRATVAALRSRGANVILDPHNYARYKPDGTPLASEGVLIGTQQVPIAAFVDLWRRLAREFGEESLSSPLLLNLMNEPHDIDVATWVDAAQQAVDAIREEGAKNLLLVPGADWTTAGDFSWSDNRNLLQSVTDPLDNFAIEVHQYVECAADPNAYVTRIAPFENWARQNRRLGYLGESAFDNNVNCRQAYENLLTHLEQNQATGTDGVWLGWNYWAVSARGDWVALENDGDSADNGYALSTLAAHLPASCDNDTKDGEETDVDCGGHCRRCASSAACLVDTDCQSGVCTAATCAANAGTGGAPPDAGTSGSGGTSTDAEAVAGGGAGAIAGASGGADTSGCSCLVGAPRGQTSKAFELFFACAAAVLTCSRRRRPPIRASSTTRSAGIADTDASRRA